MIWWNSPIGWGPLSSALRAACGARGPRHPLPINNRRLISNQWWMWAVGGGPHSACFGFFLGLFLSTNRWRPRQVEQQWNVAPASGLGFGFLGFGFWGVFIFLASFFFMPKRRIHSIESELGRSENEPCWNWVRLTTDRTSSKNPVEPVYRSRKNPMATSPGWARGGGRGRVKLFFFFYLKKKDFTILYGK